ncbi:MAG: endolytic transglycosylase MltG [Pseudomonadota bacterium]|nr:endolytic transglycosylase MltG [Pseudomonadota bacterium]
MSEVDARKPAPLWMKLLIWGGVALVVLALLAAGGAYAGYRWMQNEFAAAGPTTAARVTTLPRGSGLIRIAGQLEDEGLITDARVFRFAITLDDGDRSLRAGEYEIPAGASMAQIYELLRSGQTVQHPVTLAEGLTSAMIVRSLAEEAVLTGDISETPAEGALLPETYLVTRGTSRQEIIERMARAQDELLDALWDQRAENLPFETREQAIILASIVEKETGIGGERGEVAGVFVNRLRRGMRLESDPTIIYGISRGEPLGRGLRRSEIDNANNAWNTYQIPALPPTPIANPGREAIAAVLNPTETTALFFVADGTGGHAFADTYAEHQQNVRRWRQIERQRRQAGN